MKRYLVAVLAVVGAIMMFISCEKPEPGPYEGSYQFIEPYVVWGASLQDISQHMKSLEGWETEVSPQGTVYLHTVTKARMSFSIIDGELVSTQISYYGCKDQYSRLKSDWASKYKLSWNAEEVDGLKCDIASCSALSSSVTAGMGTTDEFEFMFVACTSEALLSR